MWATAVSVKWCDLSSFSTTLQAYVTKCMSSCFYSFDIDVNVLP